MNRSVGIVGKWQGYYVEDCACLFCLHYGGKRRGCKLNKCCCSEEKHEAAVNNRINRPRSTLQWDS